MKKILKNSVGFGVLEIMISLGILGVATYAILNGLDFLTSSKQNVEKKVYLENILSNIVESARANIAMEKVDFDADNTFLKNSVYEDVRNSLNLRWVKDGIVRASDCPNCTGRIGYVVTPLKTTSLEFRGIYKVTVRVTHDEEFPGEFKQYDFIVKGP